MRNSRKKNRRANNPRKVVAKASKRNMPEGNFTVEIPKLTTFDVAMGITEHLPAPIYDYEIKPYIEAASTLFFCGAENGCPSYLKPREGVNWKEALLFIFAHLRSFDPKHEDKMNGCGQLVKKYFYVDPDFGKELI